MDKAAPPVDCTLDVLPSDDSPAEAADADPIEPSPVTDPPAEESELPVRPAPETSTVALVSVVAPSPLATPFDVACAPSTVEPFEVPACDPAEEDALAEPLPDVPAEAELVAEADVPLSFVLAPASASPDAVVPPLLALVFPPVPELLSPLVVPPASLPAPAFAPSLAACAPASAPAPAVTSAT
jgi:hypothetical protein